MTHLCSILIIIMTILSSTYCGYTCPVNVSGTLTLVTHVHFNEVFGCTNRVNYDQEYN